MRDPTPSGRRLSAGALLFGLALALFASRWDYAHAGQLAACAPLVLLLTASNKPHWALYVLGLSIQFGDSRLYGLPTPALLASATVAGSLFAGLKSHRRIRGPHPLLAAVAGACLLYLVFAHPSSHAGLIAASDLAALPLMACAVQTMIRCLPYRESDFTYFVAGAAISVGYGLLQAYRATSSDYAGYAIDRVFQSTIGSSNYAAALGIVPGLLLLGLAMHVASRGLRVATIIASVPYLAAPLYLGSRGGTVAVLVGVLVALTQRADRFGMGAPKRGRAMLLVAVGGVAILGVTSHWLVFSRIADPGSGTGYLSGRTRLWSTALQLIGAHPIVGIGPGLTTDVFLTDFGVAYAHNLALDVLAQLGIFLGAAYLVVTFPPLLRGRSSPVLAAVVGMYIDSMVEPLVSTASGLLLYAPLIVIAGSACRTGPPVENRHYPKAAAP